MTEWLYRLLVDVSQMGAAGVALFVLLYIAAALTMAPALPLTVAAGAIYGVTKGSVLVFVSAAIGGSLAYAVASRLAGTRWLRRLDREPRVIVVRRAVRDDSVWIQFLLRLSPVVPFTMLNYALGLAKVRYRDFAVALLGMVPAIVVYTYYGRVAGDVARLASGAVSPRGPAYYALIVAGLAATALATMFIARAARRALNAPAGL